VGPEGDRGLATERTRLAWERTGLSLLVMAALLGTAVVRHPDGWIALPVVGVLVVAAAAAWRGARDGWQPAVPDPGWLTAVALLAAAGATAVLVLGFR
jgi:uncharacterized membrane protein YidH (DUF202 family)